MYRHLILIFLFHLILIGCNSHVSNEKNHLDKITLKLEKPISIKLTKAGKSPSTFNMIAEIIHTEPILEAQINWIVADSNNLKLINNKVDFLGPQLNPIFDSGLIELPDPTENYKIVFVFSGRTENEEINKTEVFNSLIQDEIDSAVLDLQERAN